ncbi:membrane protein [Arthrobacter stackebrandtii]|uniref:Membrane protein n=1 Tax=Arthrobacter stackebrandtii TaxID=272161 RepID=A0ABS4Z1T9_9MICC|nr:membrane protein [Arthrobacter stackebrandtii]
MGKRSLATFSAEGCTDLAASLTYYGILSLFPAILAVVSILGLVGQGEESTQVMLDLVGELADESVAETLGPTVQQLSGSPAAGWTFSLGLFTALWSASGFVGAFSRAMNRLYGIAEGRPVWKLRPSLLLVTVATVILVAIIALLLVISGPIAQAIGDAIGLGDAAVTAWNMAKWPVVGALTIALIAGLYYFTPNIRQPRFRWISLGAAIALTTAVLASGGFGIYLANFGKYANTYGAIAGVIVLLLWLWLLNLALLFGAVVDAEMERGRELQGGIHAEAQLQLPPRDISASLKNGARNKCWWPKGGTSGSSSPRSRERTQPKAAPNCVPCSGSPDSALPQPRSQPHAAGAATAQPHTLPPRTSSDPVRHFDLAIIGTGSGATLPGPELAHLSIAIVEEIHFGGT